ncbi:type II secretion system protein A [Cereibacter ovatus]|uniref:Type II secretion system protein A n=1 Tax=Cereibacter ovatus TaxID=439529 RepID=A0A285D3C7_9RHOB|nr:AAA family ATPase [Cereibacter ovatus]SNX74282.1 type II secretion system protein A [Cereibacter ovatus]
MAIDLYMNFFGFRERPFTLLPDPDFLYWSGAHRKAYTILEYGIATRAPLTVVTGEIGVGKTTLLQYLLSSVDPDIRIGLISNAQGERGDLLRWVLYALDIRADPDADYVSMFQQFQDFVITEYAQGRYVVLVIDEAQNLSIQTLEELRMLTNINANKDELLQLILVGQPELRRMIQDPRLEQFAQRIAAAYHLERLDETATRAYIRHRLQHVDGSGEEFTEAAIAAVHAETRGTPRLINKLCDLALVYAASAEERRVDLPIIREILSDGVFVGPFTQGALNPGGVMLLCDPVPSEKNEAAE